MAVFPRKLIPFGRTQAAQPVAVSPPEPARQGVATALDLAPDDPLVAFFLDSPTPVNVTTLKLDSPAIRSLRAQGVQVIVPLVSQGELVGLLNLGPRLSEQDYSRDDQRLLNALATQAAPAVRVAQLVREQRARARERERIAQELRVAKLIQQTLLPRELPSPDGYRIGAYYQPAREVGGDFYDFIPLDDGRLGLVIGDVTDKGVPAALVMATTRTMLRSAARSGATPGAVLAQTNDLLCPDIPPKMFVTCFYAILDPRTGRLQYANAGHDLPYTQRGTQVAELRATGMPLGLLPGMSYEEKETVLQPGDSLLLYSDGIVEAHNSTRAMFGFPHLVAVLSQRPPDADMIASVLDALANFTGSNWDQEDDVTMVTLHRAEVPMLNDGDMPEETAWHELGTWHVPSAPGNERAVIAHVSAAVEPLHLLSQTMDRLKTAVAEATMNAMEHGNAYNADLPVTVRVRFADAVLSVLISDQGGDNPIVDTPAPDLDAKLAGVQSPRGWGLFLMKNLVDEMRVSNAAHRHTVELIMRLEGDRHATPNA